jgi:hypothetical protein
MSLLDHLRIDVGDAESSGTYTPINNILGITAGELLTHFRVDVGDVPATGTYTPLNDIVGLVPGQVLTHLRVDVGDTESSGVAAPLNDFVGVSNAEMLTHLRVDIADTNVVSDSGCVTLDCLTVNGDVNVGGDVAIAGNVTFSGAQCWNTTLVNTSYSVVDTDTIVLVNNLTAGPITVTLPSAPCAGRMIFIKDVAGNANSFGITVLAAVGTIDGLAGFIVSQNYQSITLLYNGSEWNLI